MRDFKSGCSILLYLIYRIFIFVTRRGGKKKKKFYSKNNKSFRKESVKKNIYIVDFFFLFFFLQSTRLAAMKQNWPRNRVAESSFHATSGTFSPVFLAHLLRRGWSSRYFRPTTGWKPRMFACYPLVTIRRRSENRRSLYPAITGKPRGRVAYISR